MTLARLAVAEAIGTALLTMAVIGSGIAAVRLSPGDIGLELLENSIATGAALVALIVTFGSVSAAFNPVVTACQVILGDVTRRDGVTLVVAQLAGGVVGAALANLMFGLGAVTVSGHRRAGGGHLLGEVVATAGLVVVIFGCQRAGRGGQVAYVVGGYIAAAYWFTSSTSFANPALTLARTLSDTFAGIAPSSVPAFVAMQLVGGGVGLGVVAFLWPAPSLVP